MSPRETLFTVCDSFRDTRSSWPCWAPARWAGTARPPDSCLCHPRVGIAQRSPGLCLPAFHPPQLPAGSEGQLLPGGTSRAHPLTSAPNPVSSALTWDSWPLTSWSHQPLTPWGRWRPAWGPQDTSQPSSVLSEELPGASTAPPRPLLLVLSSSFPKRECHPPP